MKKTSANKRISYRDLGLTLSDDQEITKDNVMYLSEGIAVSALKTYMIYSNRDLYRLYKDLLHDIGKELKLTEHFTDEYDLTQEATCFLCEYIGQVSLDNVLANAYNLCSKTIVALWRALIL